MQPRFENVLGWLSLVHSHTHTVATFQHSSSLAVFTVPAVATVYLDFLPCSCAHQAGCQAATACVCLCSGQPAAYSRDMPGGK